MSMWTIATPRSTSWVSLDQREGQGEERSTRMRGDREVERSR